MSDVQGGGEGLPPAPQPPESRQPYPAPARPPRPAVVGNAATLWWAATGTWLLGAVLGLLLGGRTAASLNLNRSNLPAGVDPGTIKSVALVVAIVVLVVLAGLWALLVLGMRSGANWARILLAVLGALGMISTLFAAITSFVGSGDTQAGDIVQGVLDLATFVLALLGMLRMFSKEAAPYFNRA